MKKYIRTKDGKIVEIKDNMVVEPDDIRIVKQDDILQLVYKDEYICVLNEDGEIIEQADSIEELCDEFVFEDNDGHYLCNLCEQTDIDVGSKFEELIYLFNYSKKQQYKIRNCYGAIWTDEGLKYVAKLNKDGVLELI